MNKFDIDQMEKDGIPFQRIPNSQDFVISIDILKIPSGITVDDYAKELLKKYCTIDGGTDWMFNDTKFYPGSDTIKLIPNDWTTEMGIEIFHKYGVFFIQSDKVAELYTHNEPNHLMNKFEHAIVDVSNSLMNERLSHENMERIERQIRQIQKCDNEFEELCRRQLDSWFIQDIVKEAVFGKLEDDEMYNWPKNIITIPYNDMPLKDCGKGIREQMAEYPGLGSTPFTLTIDKLKESIYDLFEKGFDEVNKNTNTLLPRLSEDELKKYDALIDKIKPGYGYSFIENNFGIVLMGQTFMIDYIKSCRETGFPADLIENDILVVLEDGPSYKLTDVRWEEKK